VRGASLVQLGLGFDSGNEFGRIIGIHHVDVVSGPFEIAEAPLDLTRAFLHAGVQREKRSLLSAMSNP
jgi:hypothetical protein